MSEKRIKLGDFIKFKKFKALMEYKKTLLDRSQYFNAHCVN